MKMLKSWLIHSAGGGKKGKYKVLLEVTDYDLEQLEDLSECYTSKCSDTGVHDVNKCRYEDIDGCMLKGKYQIWIDRTFHECWQLWKRYG